MTLEHDDNTSGRGDIAELPPELKGVNWGAFLLNWIWGLGNNVWQAFLVFVPFFGFVVPFVLLFKGNEWAWKSKRWESVEHFRAVQRKWTKWSIVAAITVPLLFSGLFYLIFAGVTSSMKTSDYYIEAMEIVQNDESVLSALGSPIEPGWFVTGSIKTSGPNGSALISIPLNGSRAEGTAHVAAEMALGRWSIEAMAVEVETSGEYIVLVE